MAERYFSPVMGRNWGEKGRNTFLPGRNGRNWGEMAETGEKLPDVFILRCKT